MRLHHMLHVFTNAAANAGRRTLVLFLNIDAVFTGHLRLHCTALFSTGTRQYMCFLDGTQLGAKLKAERRLVLEPKTCITPSLIMSPLKPHAVAAHAPRSNRRTPLYLAVETGNADIVSALLAAGAEVDAENKCVCPAVWFWARLFFVTATLVQGPPHAFALRGNQRPHQCGESPS